MDWANGQRVRWAVGQVQAHHEARMRAAALAHVSSTAAASGEAVPAAAAEGEALVSERFDFDPGEVGVEVGFAPALLTFAAWEAQARAERAAWLRPLPAAPTARLGDAGGRPGCSMSLATCPCLWPRRMPASPSLRGHGVLDAGRSAGRIGHAREQRRRQQRGRLVAHRGGLGAADEPVRGRDRCGDEHLSGRRRAPSSLSTGSATSKTYGDSPAGCGRRVTPCSRRTRRRLGGACRCMQRWWRTQSTAWRPPGWGRLRCVSGDAGHYGAAHNS